MKQRGESLTKEGKSPVISGGNLYCYYNDNIILRELVCVKGDDSGR